MSKELDVTRIIDEGIQSAANNPYAEQENRRLFEREESKHKRDLSTRSQLHAVSMVALWVAAIVLLGSVIVWGWHLLTPWAFLTPEQLNSIQTVLFSVVGSSFFTVFAKKWLSTHID